MKNLTKCVLFTLGFSSLTFAGIDDRIQNLEQEMKEISTRTPQDTLGTNFSSAQPKVDSENQFFLVLEILYWHMKAGGTEFAYTTNTNADGQSIPIRGKTKQNEFEWDWGLRAGLGYHLPYEDWDLYARYTLYETENTEKTHHQLPSQIVPNRIILSQSAERAKSNINTDYQNVDVELARSYFISSRLSVRPHIGVKSSWINLNQKVTYSFPPNTDTPGLDFKSKDYCQFWGIGPQIGADSYWHLGYGLSFFGEISTSILYGYFNVKRKELYPAGVFTPEGGNICKLDNKFHLFVPFINYYLGLCWQSYVNHNRQYITLNLGYETQYYWRINQWLRSDNTIGNSASSIRLQFDHYSEDISFYGVTARFRLDF